MRWTLGATAQRRHRLDMMSTSLSPPSLRATVGEPLGLLGAGEGGGEEEEGDQRMKLFFKLLFPHITVGDAALLHCTGSTEYHRRQEEGIRECLVRPLRLTKPGSTA